MSQRIREFDWKQTRLGPISSWPQSFKTAVELALATPVPVVMLFGDNGTLIYNDGYRDFAGKRHPKILGMPVLDAWPEVAEFNQLVMDTCLAGGTLSPREKLMVLNRHGKPEDVWLDLDYSPIRDESGKPFGVFVTVIETTQKLKAERALRAREADLARAQEIGGVGGVDVDLVNGFKSRRSPEYLKIHGLTSASVNETHQDWVNRLHPEDREKTEKHFLAAVAGDIREYNSEYRIIRPSDGQERWIAVRAHIERDENGRALRLVGTHIDITDRKRIETALRESEERFRLIANSAPVPMWVSELGGKRAFVNQAYMDFLGVTYDEGLVYDWRKSLHPDDIPRIVEEQIAGESSKKPFSLEMRVRDAQGEWRWVRSQSQPRWSPTGEHIGFIGVAHDITAAKHAETRLRYENLALEGTVAERTRERDRIWSVSQDLFVVADKNGVWTQINPAWTETLGWSEGELLGKTSAWLEHPEDLERTKGEIGRLAKGIRTSRFENRFRHKDGSYRWLEWTAVLDDDLIFAVARDVTYEKEAEEALRRTEEALRQSQKMEAVGQLTGGIAHDFNNLLQGIVGSLDLVQKRVQQGRIHEIERFIAGAMTSANRAAALTHRLLAFSRRQPLAPKPCSVNMVLTSMEDLLRRSMGENIVIEFARDENAALTYCDQNQLENAILNLAINARDAMPDGGTLRVRTKNLPIPDFSVASALDIKPGDYVEITVSDTGTGMTPDVADRAFEPFFTTKPTGQGTGLGLSMIYGFTRQSDGTVAIESTPGTGTSVRILLPRYQGSATEIDGADQPVGATPAAQQGETILVVEDEAIVRSLIVETLSELGYETIEAVDGPSGLDILQSDKKIDMLITDIGLPGLNGRQIADAALTKRPELKILFMTGYAENAALANGVLDAGMEMITKPFTIDALAKKVRSIIEQ